MANSKLKKAKINTCPQKNFDKKAAGGGNALQPKALAQSAKNPKPAENSFSIPHTPLFYLLFHAILASVAVAVARKKGEKTEPILPVGVDFEPSDLENGDYELIFTKGGDRVKTRGQFFAEIAALRGAEKDLIATAFVYLMSQGRRFGKSWKRKGAEIDVYLKDFQQFAGAKAKITNKVLSKTARAVINAEIFSLRGKAWRSCPALFDNAAPIYYDTEPAENTEPAKKRRQKGVKISIEKENKTFARVVRATHLVENPLTAAFALPAEKPKRQRRVGLKTREFLIYLEIKSAAALGFGSTALTNIMAAGGIEKPKGRHKARFIKSANEILKKIGDFDVDFYRAEIDVVKSDLFSSQVRFAGVEKPAPAVVESGGGVEKPAALPAENDTAAVALILACVNVYLSGDRPPLFSYLSATPLALPAENPPPKALPAPAENPKSTVENPRKSARFYTTDKLPAELENAEAQNDSDFGRKDFKTRLDAFLAPWLKFFKKLSNCPTKDEKTRYGLLKAFWRALWLFLKDFFAGKFLRRVYLRIRARLTDLFRKWG